MHSKDPESITCTRLHEVFQIGVRIDVNVHLDEDGNAVDDGATRVAWQCLQHDAETNVYQDSSVSQRIQVAQSFFQSEGGWKEASAKMQKLFGASKRTTIARWAQAAQHLDAQVKDFMRQPQHRWA